MRQRISKNQKGTVLLTVICFTTMCMFIVAMALKFANQSNSQSTKNVMKAQAQVTAEHYLQQYLSTFPMTTGADGQSRVNYDKLKTLAGASASAPATISIEIQPSAGATSSVNISTGDLANTAVYGGNCVISIYKDGADGIVVRAEADYNGETGVSSAYFYGQTPSADLNKNAIEVCGNYDVENGANVKGDVLVDADPNGIIRFNNSNGTGYYSNYNTNGNLSQHTNPVQFHDTIFNNAPTITVGGHLYVWQLEITSVVGKTDVNGNTKGVNQANPGIGYDRNNLLNRNGYINVGHKFVALCNPSGLKIGDSNNDIDVYTYGMIIGAMPTTAYGTYSADDVQNFRSKIINIGGGKTDNDGGGTTIYGNIYSRKRDGGTIEDDGDFIVNAQNGVTVKGDLCVEGNIRVMYGTLTVEGNLVCQGQIICTGNGKVVNGGSTYSGTLSVNNVWPSEVRAETPSMEYAPGLYQFGVNDDPVINSPKNYRALSTNVMYADGTEKSKYFKQNFENALKYGLGDTYGGGSKVCPQYVDENIANKELTINHSCVLTEYEAGVGKSGGNDGAKYTVNVQNEDIWILLPAQQSGESFISARFLVNNPGNGHHVYFAFYNPTGVTITNGKVDVASINITKAAYLYLHNSYTSSNMPKIYMNPNIHGEVAMGTTAFAKNSWTSKRDGSNETQLNTTAKTNIIVLIPDGIYFKLGYNGWYGCYNAVFYGPKSEFVLRQNEGNRVYGQIKVDKYTIDEAEQQTQSVQYVELEDDSLLHSWLTQGSGATGALNFQYYIKAK